MKPFLEPNQLAPLLNSRRQSGQKVVLTNGVFDLLHLGHVTYLKQARALGDCLVVALNSDPSVRKIKGPSKPLIPLAERAEMLLALSCVDYATFFDEETPFNVIQALKPDVLVKGGDWALDRIVGADSVKSWGGTVTNIPIVPGRSTTNLVDLVVRRYGSKASS